MTIEYATALDIGNRKRQAGGINEDSIAVSVLEDGHLDTDRQAGIFVLADGAGGEEAGEIASYIASVEVARGLTERAWESRCFAGGRSGIPASDRGRRLDESAAVSSLGSADPERILAWIDAAIQEAHTHILECVRDLELGSAYSTVVAGVVVDDRLYFGWVGDSRIYIVTAQPEAATDEISQLTRDHSVVERMVQRGEIDPVEAHVHRKGTQITRALGGTIEDAAEQRSVEVDTNSVRLFAEDTVLFTSDGLIDANIDAPTLHEEYLQTEGSSSIERSILEKSVTDDEIRDVVIDAESLEAAAGAFVTLANQRGGKDNVSIILVQNPTLSSLPPEGPPGRAFNRSFDAVDDATTVIGDPEH